MRIVLAIAGVILFGAVAVAASGSREPSMSGPTPQPFYTAIPAVATLAPEIGDRIARPDAGLAGRFIVPIEGAEIPVDPELLPGAPRDYRSGVHEGIDFPAPAGTPVRAAAAGSVVRVDSNYTEWTEDEMEAALDEAQALGHTPAATLDRIRGRQVWIDHGAEITSRYAHLSSVEPLTVGQRVEAGAPIGAVGSSGYPQGGPHLHFEVRRGEYFYADGQSGDALARAVRRLFR
jgi:murein DD-endopeptidase MepM/ murein hydrolase activator NlpD